MKKITLFLIFSITGLMISSCSNENNEYEKKNMTFEDVEKLINSEKPFSELSKKSVLERYGSVEHFYELILQQQEKIKNKKGSSTSKMAAQKRVLVEFPGGNQYFFCHDYEYLLDRMQEIGLDESCSDRAGATSSCVSRLYSGSVDQSDQIFLTDYEMEKGWVLICRAYPLYDIHIRTQMEGIFTGGKW
ncbi:2Fe-2S iron-sulfur cluster-binding protein [Flavobacterium anhuiense]|uniref:2Fe-2S iron-sulfur cluster-binding protein n=1 Tax=Flavobacterium anhuiense TaxID=459526 RepID=UPI0020264602|nr:2Fe-2S iron-sulfur cluster-binding protein [Flavobacterium anhuiense]URM35450.1 hypothetical protein LLY39_13440 [Flavobacterium anhuiense]